MTRHTKKILDRYRQLESLDRDARERVMRTLERRIANGESSLLGINVEPPTLPVTHSVLSFAAGNVGVKIGVAVVLTAASSALLWRGLEVQRAEQRASPAPITTPATSSVPSPLPTVPQQAVAATKAERLAQPLDNQQPSTATDRTVDERSFPKPIAKHNSGYSARTQQPATSSPSEKTAKTTIVPQVTDRFDGVVSVPTTGYRRIQNEQIKPNKERQDVIEPEKKADPARSDSVAPQLPHQEQKSTLDEEMKLLRAAHAALRAGNPRRALVELAEHTWHFPNGELAESRDVTRIIALCQAGEVVISRSEAKRFVAERPSSPFVGRVLATCAERPKRSP